MQLNTEIKEHVEEELDKIETELDACINILVQFDRTKDLDDILFQLTETMNKAVYTKGLLELYTCIGT